MHQHLFLWTLSAIAVVNSVATINNDDSTKPLEGSTAKLSATTSQGTEKGIVEELIAGLNKLGDGTNPNGDRSSATISVSTNHAVPVEGTTNAEANGEGDSTNGLIHKSKEGIVEGVPNSGVVYNYLESDLVAKGFVKCYDQPYSSYTSSSNLLPCSGSQYVFVGAKSTSSATKFAIGAFGKSTAVFQNTYSLNTANYDSVGGAYWYRYAGKSFGFAASSSVNLNSCDYGQVSPDCAHRLCWHLDQPYGGYRAGCTVALNSDSTWRKVIYKSALPPCGVQYDYDESDLIQKGFVQCYNQPYNAATTSANLAACTGSEYVFVGAKKSLASTKFAIGAFGVTSNVFQSTVSTTTANLDAGGAYWYRYAGWSFGFAASSTVNLNSCDYNNPDCSSRLCWHLDQGVGGYRAGCTVALNGDSTWRKVIYRGSNLPTCSPVAVPSCGVLHNYPEKALIQKRFVKCYDQPYSASTTSADLALCSGASLIFVGAKSSFGSTDIEIGAFGVSTNVLQTTSSTTQAYIDAAGAYWYRVPNKSFGFASSSTVNLNSCDYNLPDCANRLCYHLDQNVGGYRAGCTVSLNYDSTWRKVMYKGNYLNSCSPDILEVAADHNSETTH